MYLFFVFDVKWQMKITRKDETKTLGLGALHSPQMRFPFLS